MRLFLADPGLRANIGHHANGCRHIADHARARGIETHVLAHKDVEPSLRASLQARPFFRAFTYDLSDGDPYCGWLSGFHKSAAAVVDDLTGLTNVTRDDVVFFHGAQPAQLMGAAEWANRLSEKNCPLIIVELATEPGVDVEMQGSRMILDIPHPRKDPRPTLFRFTALGMDRLKGKPLRIITYNAGVSEIYTELLGRSVGVLPFPTPPDTARRSRAKKRPITISVLGHQQFRKGYHLVPAVVDHMLRTTTDVNFLIHNSDPELTLTTGSLMRDTQDLLRQMASVDTRVRLEARAVEFDEWVGLLDISDLILCPYDPARYAHGHSGLASMAIANAIPLVVPAGTPLAAWLDNFGGPGTTFESFNEASVIQAVECAVAGFDLYAERAVTAALRWSAVNGPDKFIDTIVDLSRQRAKGALPAVVGAPAKPAHPLAKRADKRVPPAKAAAAPLPGRRSAKGLSMAGVELAARGDLAGALTAFDAALQEAPTFAEAWFYRGVALEKLDRLPDAYDAYAQALMHAPLYDDAQQRLATLASILGRPAAVLTPWASNPAPSVIAQLRHKASLLSGKRDEFQYSYQDPDEATLRARVLENPRSAADATALGRVLTAQGRAVEAELFFKYALRLEPWSGEAAVRLCAALETQHARIPEVTKVVNDAIAAGAADDRLIPMALWAEASLAEWQDERDRRDQVMAAFARTPSAISPFSMLHYTDDPALHRKCAAAYFEKATGSTTAQPRTKKQHRGQPLTVGYISADFRHHAVAHLCAEIFELHDRRRVRSVGFATFTGVLAEIGPRVRGAFDSFVDLAGLSHDAAVQKISEADLDILVDLTGYTHHARPEILAEKLAPIQVNFLGYPGTLGTDVVDYIIADEIVAPLDHAKWYAERLVHMPHSYQVNDRKRPKGARKLTRAQAGLPDHGAVFACFNEVRKVNPATFRVWMQILKRVPGSVLWLYAASPAASENFRREAADAGVDPMRLVVAGNVKHDEHLARYRLVDLVLDTQPYGAHTTASDALWVGCPVITLLGNSFAGRVGASLLSAVGMSELITKSWQEYEDLAVRLGGDATARAELRTKLQRIGPRSMLFDSPRFTRQLEWAYGEMWRRYTSGDAPQAFQVPDL